MRIKSLITKLLVVGVLASVVGYNIGQALAQTGLLTGSNNAAPKNWEVAYQDRSVLQGPERILVGFYHFNVHGGALGDKALGPHSLRSTVVPNGFIITEVVIDIHDAVLPATSTNALFIHTAADVATGTVAFATTGLKPSVIDGTFANYLKVTNDTTLKLTTTGNAITSGAFEVYAVGFQSF